MRKISPVIIGSLLLTSVAFADVAQFSLTTHPQTILPNTLSGPITLQAQNGSGSQEVTTETTDLTFTSTSPTGQFEGSTGKPVSKTMAKGTANRTFYYIDPTIGTYTITVTATGRTSKQSFSDSQQIIIATTLPQKVVVTPKTPMKTTATVTTKTKISSTAPVQTLTTFSLGVVATLPPSTSTGNLATVYEAKPQASTFDSIFDWPRKLWSWIASLL